MAFTTPGTTTVTSVLTEIECLRSLDRLFARKHLSADDLADARETVYDALEISDLIALHPAILRRAAAPLPTPLATLDALHLSTALLLVEMDPDNPLTFATHDIELARCARACGLDVIGV